MILISKAQISKIHVLLSQLKLTDEKQNFVSQFSKGRVKSTRDLTMNEAKEMLQYLSSVDPFEKMRRKVFALAYAANIIWGDSPADKRMNAVKLNEFLMSKGTVKKEINKMNDKELIKTINQFDQIIKHMEGSQAGKITRSVLNELNIPITAKRETKAS